MKISLILTCAGKGSRAGFDKNKLLVPVNGRTCLDVALSAFSSSGLIDQYIVTASETDFDEVKKRVGDEVTVVMGGETRSQSVRNALKFVSGDIVLIHDGARPFVTKRIISDCINSVINFGSGITALPSYDTICSASEDGIEDYIGKDGLYSVQTPQGFFSSDIVKAYEQAGSQNFNDDGSVYSKYIGIPHIVLGDRKNVKLTFADDFELLKFSSTCRNGVGFDCHRLCENRKLILGGIEIPYKKGLLGHSDADVLTHAIMDAILSACSLRDIGYWFPDKDEKYKDANSIELLKKVLQMMDEKGFEIKNISAVIMAEKPKLLNFIPKISQNLSNVCGINTDQIGITATTLEGLGFVGREEGICVNSSVTITLKKDI